LVVSHAWPTYDDTENRILYGLGLGRILEE